MAEQTVYCPVSYTLHLIGGKYKALLLWRLTEGNQRYSQLQRAVPQATAKMLTQQLRELEADGLITRQVFPEVPPKVVYSLTAKGSSLYPVLRLIYDWGSEALLKEGHTPNCAMTDSRCTPGCRMAETNE